MVSLLFWNVNNSIITKTIALACHENDIDILILAEFTESSVDLLFELNAGQTRIYTEVFRTIARVRLFSRYPSKSLLPLYEDGYSIIYNLSPPVGKQLIIASTHLPSKMYQDEDAQHMLIARLSKQILNCEERQNHDNSLVIGDLNANPFEKGMIATDGFHSVMDKSIAEKVARRFMDVDYKFFYNPMWNRLGDETAGPCGTYYYNSGYKSFHWNTFDQVLIRPSLIEDYKHDNLKILTEINSVSLLKNGKINHDFSDHLPLMITLEIEKVT